MSKKELVKIYMKGITKRFGSFTALDNVDFQLRKGEIHVLIGENGAGKTTLMNVLYGLYQSEHGKIFMDDSKINITCPSDAIESGIGMVHQHFMLVHNLTVVENIILGNEISNYGRLDIKKATKDIQQLIDKYGFKVNPNDKIHDLTVGQEQKVEILKLLYRGADVMILDEPTAVLTPNEIDELAVILDQMKKDGKSIILITHKLKEVLKMSDRITILRHGKVTGVMLTENATAASIAECMVGKKVELNVNVERKIGKKSIIEINNIVSYDGRKLPVLNGVNLTVKSGEILGVAGVSGNGQNDLVEAIMGLRKIVSGKVVFNNKDITNLNTKEIVKQGISCVHENRHARSMILPMSLYENAILGSLEDNRFLKKTWIDYKSLKNYSKNLIDDYDVRTPNVETEAMWLSGGNQQKFVMARELYREHELLIVAQPTRGVDIGAKQFIHNQIIADRDAGKAIMLVSTELEEILKLSDRIAVMYKGEIIKILPNKDIDQRFLGLMMTGVKEDHDGEREE